MATKQAARRQVRDGPDDVEARLRAACLALPGTTETRSWGHPNFHAGRHVYAAFETVRGKPSIAFRLAPEDVTRSLSTPGCFATPRGRGEWVSLDVSGRFSWTRVRQLLVRAHRLAAGEPAARAFRLSGAVRRSREIDTWFETRDDELGALACHWFGAMRAAGRDVREVLHDGCPVACVGDVAFGYVNVFRGHVNAGFYNGAELADPAGLLEGSGKAMRHVKLWPFRDLDDDALRALIGAAAAGARAKRGHAA